MKWLSVKKYKPPYDMQVLTISTSLGLRICWLSLEGWRTEDNPYEIKVTHFCIPDPIEIEEE